MRQDSEQLMTGPSQGSGPAVTADLSCLRPSLLDSTQHQGVGGWANTQCLFYPANTKGATRGSSYSHLVDRVTLEAGGESSWGPRSPDSLLQSATLAVLILPLLSSPLDHCVSNVYVSECSVSTFIRLANHCVWIERTSSIELSPRCYFLEITYFNYVHV